jgi:hypothetical protein
LVVAGKEIEQCGWKKGKFGRVCSSTGFIEERERVEEGMATAALWMAGGEVAAGKHSGAPWRAQERTPGKGYSGGRSRGDAWLESRQELNGGEARQRPGGRVCASGRAEAEGAEGVQR